MGSENDNRTINRSCKNCLWGDKCRDMDVNACRLVDIPCRLVDIPCEDYWEIDEDAEIEHIIEMERLKYMEQWEEYSREWELDDQ